MNPAPFQHPLNLINNDISSNLYSYQALARSKLDKSQARRLKMPKRNRSAYFLFSMDTRAKLKIEFKDQLTPLEMQAKVSQYWKELSPQEKDKYKARAKQEKLEYLIALEKFYSNLTPEILARSKTNRPKKPCSAYAHFVRDTKISLKKENPRLIMQEILHIASDKWKNLPEKDRIAYEEKARRDKEQYMAITRSLPVGVEMPYNTRKQGHEEYRGKRSQTMSEELFEEEEEITKQVKVETSIVKSENLENGDSEYVKAEEYPNHYVQSNSPFTTKAESEYEQENRDRSSNNTELKLEPVEFQTTPYFNNMDTIQVPRLNQEYIQRNMNYGPMIGYNPNYQRMEQIVPQELSWMRMVQTNRGFDEAIMRKIAEVKALQAQRLMLNQNAFWATNRPF